MQVNTPQGILSVVIIISVNGTTASCFTHLRNFFFKCQEKSSADSYPISALSSLPMTSCWPRRPPSARIRAARLPLYLSLLSKRWCRIITQKMNYVLTPQGCVALAGAGRAEGHSQLSLPLHPGSKLYSSYGSVSVSIFI